MTVSASDAAAEGAAGRPAGLAASWRWLPGVAGLVVWLALAAAALNPQCWTWAQSHLPWMINPIFHDLHVVRLGWETQQAGGDPLMAADHPFNYPRMILLAGRLGGLQLPAEAEGLLSAALFLGTLVVVLKPRSRCEAVFAALVIASPPVLLMIERGNLDQWVLVLVAAGLALLARSRPENWTMAAGAVLLGLATLIKLYPAAVMVGAAIFWRGLRRRVLVLAGLAVVLWCVLDLEEIVMVIKKTPRGLEPAYGRMLAGSRYYWEVVGPHWTAEAARSYQAIVMPGSFLICAGLLLAAAGIGWRLRWRFYGTMVPPVGQVFFWAGALIYAGTFLLGSNWSYRLVFLLLCVPGLWQSARLGRVRWWARASLAAIGLILWAPFHLALGWFFLHETVEWALAGLLVAGAAAQLALGLPGDEVVG
jgi:hypothetical protein